MDIAADHNAALRDALIVGEPITIDGESFRALIPFPEQIVSGVDADGRRAVDGSIEITVAKPEPVKWREGKSTAVIRGRNYRLESWRDEGSGGMAATLNFEFIQD